MRRQYHRWFSSRLAREMELLVFGHAGARTIVFPTRTGRFYDYENWGLVRAVSPKIEAGELQLFCLDSIDAESLYCSVAHPSARIARHIQFEEYVLNEVLPLTARMNSDPRLVTHGCSIGAYHAVNMALRHPQLFRKVVALSGRFDLTRPVGEFRNLFDGYYDQAIYFHTPPHFVPNIQDPEILKRLRALEIVLAIGATDPFRLDNENLSTALWNKGIWHALEIWPGEAHRPRHWREMAAKYL